ncbi:SCO family protein [Arsenicitalea aurantiaca]|uniref:SCO family protein n=2 Tax=Arsenicitalea aurantiaca TaxID=1783274 RepID=A0A433XM66_9HYPH|nr:SCO family protein [Arsenicitalea aurantiaca]
MTRTILWALVAVAALGAGWIYYTQTQAPQPRATASGAPYGAGEYTLVDHTGQPFTREDMMGRPAMVFFGFTHCPDVCPTTLADMAGWYERLGADAEAVDAYFVTVDPERDTPEVIANYISWNDRVTGLTGTPEEVAKVVEAWGILAQRVELEGGGYNVDHTASVLLIGPDGDFFGTIAYLESADTAVGKLQRLIAEG